MRTVLTPNPTVRSIALLVSRIILGVILVAHGYQKFAEWTLAGTGQAFAGMGIPLHAVSAAVAAIIELVGGILLILGAFTPIVGVLVFLQMLVAAVLVHIGNGIFVADGGWELVGAIGAGALALAAAGAGRWSVDGLLLSRTERALTEARRESVSA